MKENLANNFVLEDLQ